MQSPAAVTAPENASYLLARAERFVKNWRISDIIPGEAGQFEVDDLISSVRNFPAPDAETRANLDPVLDHLDMMRHRIYDTSQGRSFAFLDLLSVFIEFFKKLAERLEQRPAAVNTAAAAADGTQQASDTQRGEELALLRRYQALVIGEGKSLSRRKQGGQSYNATVAEINSLTLRVQCATNLRDVSFIFRDFQTIARSPQPTRQPTSSPRSPAARPVELQGGEQSSPQGRRDIEPQGEGDPILLAIETSYNHLPSTTDARVRPGYKQVAPWHVSPPQFPSRPLNCFDNPEFFERLDLKTLFFVFYNQPGTYQQLLAACELKRNNWRLHQGESPAWFQRKDEPFVQTHEYERGNFVYFDHEKDWTAKVKNNFLFEYQYLEDDLQVE